MKQKYWLSEFIENYYRKMPLQKYYFIKDIENFCRTSDEEYFDKDCINVFLATLRK